MEHNLRLPESQPTESHKTVVVQHARIIENHVYLFPPIRESRCHRTGTPVHVHSQNGYDNTIGKIIAWCIFAAGSPSFLACKSHELAVPPAMLRLHAHCPPAATTPPHESMQKQYEDDTPARQKQRAVHNAGRSSKVEKRRHFGPIQGIPEVGHAAGRWQVMHTQESQWNMQIFSFKQFCMRWAISHTLA